MFSPENYFWPKLFSEGVQDWSLPLNYSIPESPIAFRNNDSSTYNPLQPSFVEKLLLGCLARCFASWKVSWKTKKCQVQTSARIKAPWPTRPPPRLRSFKKPRKTNRPVGRSLWGLFTSSLFRGVQISTRPKTLIFAHSFQSLKYPGLPARDDGSMWHLWCDVRPSFKAGWVGRLRLTIVSIWVVLHVLLWRHWAVTLLHIKKKTFLILHLRVNALFWCMGFQLTQCPAMFQNTKSGPLRDAIVEKAQNNCWEGPVKKKNQIKFLVSCVIFMLPHHAKHHEKQL